MPYREMLSTLSERFRDVATVKVVFGDAIEAEGKTLIPVARVAFGLGGGSAPGRLGRVLAGEELGGGGGGVAAAPVGVVEVTPDATRFLPFDQTPKLLALFAAGCLAGWALGRSRRRS